MVKDPMVMAVTSLLFGALLVPFSAGAEGRKGLLPADGDTLFVVQEYRYDPGHADGNREIGLSLCGTRCNGLSDNFDDYTMPGGWRLIRVAENQERTVDLDNPFLQGKCICVGDEYRIDWYEPGTPYRQRTIGSGRAQGKLHSGAIASDRGDAASLPDGGRP
jgi:hypothetical protein